jgi:thiol-disulfide isomerase/thioredoxin
MFFSKRRAVSEGPSNYLLADSVRNQPLPKSRLIDQSGATIDDDFLRQGKVILVLLNPNCKACEKESAFLSIVAPLRSDIKFFGIATLGEVPKLENPKESPFQGIFADGGFVLSRSLSVDRLPMTYFIDNGLVKNAWMGAPNNDKRKAEFIEWFKHLS